MQLFHFASFLYSAWFDSEYSRYFLLHINFITHNLGVTQSINWMCNNTSIINLLTSIEINIIVKDKWNKSSYLRKNLKMRNCSVLNHCLLIVHARKFYFAFKKILLKPTHVDNLCTITSKVVRTVTNFNKILLYSLIKINTSEW